MLREWLRKICFGLPLVLLNAMMFVALGHVNSALAADAIDFSKAPKAGEQVAQKLILENLPAQAIQYWIYLPKNYTASDTSKKWPVMLFLHGAGESGSDLEKVKKHGPQARGNLA